MKDTPGVLAGVKAQPTWVLLTCASLLALGLAVGILLWVSNTTIFRPQIKTVTDTVTV